MVETIQNSFINKLLNIKFEIRLYLFAAMALSTSSCCLVFSSFN